MAELGLKPRSPNSWACVPAPELARQNRHSGRVRQECELVTPGHAELGGHCLPSYYQKKLKEGTCKTREMELTTGQLRSRKKLLHNPQQADALEIPERRVLRILSRLKQQNYGEGPGMVETLVCPRGLFPWAPTQPGPRTKKHGFPLWA